MTSSGKDDFITLRRVEVPSTPCAAIPGELLPEPKQQHKIGSRVRYQFHLGCGGMDECTVSAKVLDTYIYSKYDPETGNLVAYRDYAILLEGDKYPRRVEECYLTSCGPHVVKDEVDGSSPLEEFTDPEAVEDAKLLTDDPLGDYFASYKTDGRAFEVHFFDDGKVLTASVYKSPYLSVAEAADYRGKAIGLVREKCPERVSGRTLRTLWDPRGIERGSIW